MTNFQFLPQSLLIHAWIFWPVLVWTLVWKGLALWKAARKNHSIWFIALLILNTIGILEILYIYVFSEPKKIPLETKDNA
jgi:hypothetical protein